MTDNGTDFGFEKVSFAEKTAKVRDVFNSVANKYDVMNDLMSLGIHRYWKKMAVIMCQVRAKQKILDLAGGTGDLTQNFALQAGPEGTVVLADINNSMLTIGRKKLIDKGIIKTVKFIQTNAEELAFSDNYFDCVSIAFGLRNVTKKELALNEMFRVLKPGGRLVILEFSHPTSGSIQKAYELYSFAILPLLGKLVANDADSYKYLAESIQMHPNQEKLKIMLENSGFDNCSYKNLTAGICAIHMGFKF